MLSSRPPWTRSSAHDSDLTHFIPVPGDALERPRARPHHERPRGDAFNASLSRLSHVVTKLERRGCGSADAVADEQAGHPGHPHRRRLGRAGQGGAEPRETVRSLVFDGLAADDVAALERIGHVVERIETSARLDLLSGPRHEGTTAPVAAARTMHWDRRVVAMSGTRTRKAVLVVTALIVLSACAAGPNPGVDTGPRPGKLLARPVAGADQPDHLRHLAVHRRREHLRGAEQRQLVRLGSSSGSRWPSAAPCGSGVNPLRPSSPGGGMTTIAGSTVVRRPSRRSSTSSPTAATSRSTTPELVRSVMLARPGARWHPLVGDHGGARPGGPPGVEDDDLQPASAARVGVVDAGHGHGRRGHLRTDPDGTRVSWSWQPYTARPAQAGHPEVPDPDQCIQNSDRPGTA